MKKKLFKVKNKKKNIFFYLIIFIFFIFITSFFLFFKKNKYFIIPQNTVSFFLIPDDKGGKKIPNQNKKGLHLSYDEEEINSINNIFETNFSIQIFSSNSYSDTINKRLGLLNNPESFFKSDDLFISFFNSSLGSEYLLLYKNFETRNNAVNHCNKYIFFVDKCLIVNLNSLSIDKLN